MSIITTIAVSAVGVAGAVVTIVWWASGKTFPEWLSGSRKRDSHSPSPAQAALQLAVDAKPVPGASPESVSRVSAKPDVINPDQGTADGVTAYRFEFRFEYDDQVPGTIGHKIVIKDKNDPFHWADLGFYYDTPGATKVRVFLTPRGGQTASAVWEAGEIRQGQVTRLEAEGFATQMLIGDYEIAPMPHPVRPIPAVFVSLSFMMTASVDAEHECQAIEREGNADAGG